MDEIVDDRNQDAFEKAVQGAFATEGMVATDFVLIARTITDDGLPGVSFVTSRDDTCIAHAGLIAWAERRIGVELEDFVLGEVFDD